MQQLALHFERQGIRYTSDGPPELWCAYCTTYQQEVAAAAEARGRSGSPESSGPSSPVAESATSSSSPPPPPLPSQRCGVGSTKEAILAHCATRTHLYLYEHHVQSGLQHWCPVMLHGYRMLLNHHCIYPARQFGDGRLLMDTSISGDMVLGLDVCGGVRLWPQHQYKVVEFILPSALAGVREVCVPSSTAADSGAAHDALTAAPVLNTSSLPLNEASSPSRRRGRRVRLLHETCEIPTEVAMSYLTDDVQAEPWRRHVLRPKSAADEPKPVYVLDENNSALPSYTSSTRHVSSPRVLEGSLRSVLEVTNAAILGEARRRRHRRLRTRKFLIPAAAGKRKDKERAET